MNSLAKNPIGHRLKLEMKKRGLTSADVAKRAQVKTSFIYDVISGKSANPSTVKLARVADALSVSLNELVSDLAGTARGDSFVSVPRLTAEGGVLVSLPQPGECCRFHASWIRERLEARPEDLRLLQVRDDSMAPALGHNDMLLIDTSRKSPSPPGMFALFDGMGLAIRRLEHVPGQSPPRVRVIADNAKYSTYECSPEDALIIGRVVWLARET